LVSLARHTHSAQCTVLRIRRKRLEESETAYGTHLTGVVNNRDALRKKVCTDQCSIDRMYHTHNLIHDERKQCNPNCYLPCRLPNSNIHQCTGPPKDEPNEIRDQPFIKQTHERFSTHQPPSLASALVLENHTLHRIPTPMPTPHIHGRRPRPNRWGSLHHTRPRWWRRLLPRRPLQRTRRRASARLSRRQSSTITLSPRRRRRRLREILHFRTTSLHRRRRANRRAAGAFRFLPCKHKVRPRRRLLLHIGFAHHLAQHLHPYILVRAAVGVKVDGLAVGEADAETFLDVLVAFVFLGERGLPTALAARITGGRICD